MTVTVPERNRAIKKLLEATYGKGCVSVKAGNGTAYHWVEIKFINSVPEALIVASGRYGDLCGKLEALIRDAGIYLSSWTDDMGDDRTCISITMPRVR